MGKLQGSRSRDEPDGRRVKVTHRARCRRAPLWLRSGVSPIGACTDLIPQGAPHRVTALEHLGCSPPMARAKRTSRSELPILLLETPCASPSLCHPPFARAAIDPTDGRGCAGRAAASQSDRRQRHRCSTPPLVTDQSDAEPGRRRPPGRAAGLAEPHSANPGAETKTASIMSVFLPRLVAPS
jgi:hypothetical protein